MSLGLHARYGGWAVVTGASSGLGTHFAEQLAAEGFALVLTARRKDRLDELAARLGNEHGVKTLVVPLDLSVPGATAQLVEAIGEREIGMVIANAGFGFSGRFEDVDLATYERMIQLNCTAPTALCHAFVPALRARGRGGIVIVSSIAGHQPTPFFAVYGATKAFDLMLAEALWDELHGTGVDVVGLCPGGTRTEFANQAHMREESAGAEPGPVVAAALRRLGRGPSVLPGFAMKIAGSMHRFLPRSWVAASTGGTLARSLLGKSKADARRGR